MKAEAVSSTFRGIPETVSVRVMRLLTYAAIVTLQLILFIPYSLERFIARDEGYYALAAKLVSQGKILYSDFFYTQMPFLPYVYGMWMRIFGYDWINIRILSSVLVALLGVLLFERLRKINVTAAIFGLVLFCSSHFIYAWYLTIQTYALGVLLLFTSYLCFERGNKFWAGVLLGLATCTRLYLIAVIAPLLFVMAWNSRKDFKQHFMALSYGLALGLLPAIILFCLNPEAFIFNNLGFHLGRSEMSLRQNLWTKWVITKSLLSIRQSDKFIGSEFLILSIGAVIYLVSQLKNKAKLDSAVPVIATLYLVSMLPAPSYIQYFSVLIPFLIVCVIEVAAQAFGSPSKKLCILYAAILIVTLIGYLHPLKENLEKYTVSAEGVPGIGKSKDPDDWRVSTVRKIGAAINKNITPGQTVFALWPGYLINSDGAMFAGFENHFGWKFAAKLSAEQRNLSNIASLNDGIAAVAAGSPDLVILSEREYRRYFRSAVVSGGYKLAAKIENIFLYGKLVD